MRGRLVHFQLQFSILIAHFMPKGRRVIRSRADTSCGQQQQQQHYRRLKVASFLETENGVLRPHELWGDPLMAMVQGCHESSISHESQTCIYGPCQPWQGHTCSSSLFVVSVKERKEEERDAI